MRLSRWRQTLVLCSLVLFLGSSHCVVAQENIPPEWLVPIGGGAAPAAPANANAGTTAPENGAGTGAGPQNGAGLAAATTNPPATPTPAAPASNNPPADQNANNGGALPANNNPATTAGGNSNTPAADPNAANANAGNQNAAPTNPAPAAPANPTPTQSPAANNNNNNNAVTAGGGGTPPVGAAAGTTPVDAAAVAAPPGQLVAAGAGAPGAAPGGVPVVVPDAALADETLPMPPPIPENRPPAPPADWSALPVDTEIIFGLRLVGAYLVPWTKAKSWVFTTVLHDRYLLSVDIDDIETGPLETTVYNIPASDIEGSRRRSLLSRARALLQDPTSTIGTAVHLRVKVHTNYIRVESEVRSVVDGVSSGSLARDLSMSLGDPVDNVTLTAQPITHPYDWIEDPNASTGGSLPGWIIGCIVGAVLVVMPIPAYIMYKRHKRKHLEAVEKQQAEAAAARQRMQSRIVKSGGKSFTHGRNGSADHDILARSGSIASYGGYGGSQYGPPESVADEKSDYVRQDSMSFHGRQLMRSPGISRGMTPQQQRYQEQSLGGPGGLPSRAPSFARMSTISSMSFNRAAVMPEVTRGSDEASTSSGNLSDRRPI